jgi:hypothetical protein
VNEKSIKDQIQSFSKLSNDELLAMFIKLSAAEKAKDGGAGMSRIIERIRPILNVEQRKRLDEVLSANG